ncbi:conjugative transfer signal peptidase TraF [Dyella flava]|uniref:Conjugative transfer signal peptidase TraF n=1 Tax=Dyella flava TaxID=1920170 RepID=A0ABS2K577_9GAMM|nr:conjugative transfer signal peptidase TraF [Dyella flava]MBM7126034.1 conjugative transfer signal peptidase TraF [Dyella flava]GLQ49165.1 conjugal transfer protein TraF [Dyella flava]
MKKQARFRRGWPRICRKLAIAAISLLLLMGLLCVLGARLNLTASLPLGVYWAIHQPITHGAYVRFCPPAEGAFAMARERGYLGTGYCPSGYSPMLKRVGGMQGDSVEVSDAGTWINGRFVPLSARWQADPAGRPLPKPGQSHYALQPAQLWVISDTNDHSFDSRYFGPIDRAWVVEIVRPVLTWK